MYSPRSRVRFWEQEGHKWNTLQLKGRKYSNPQSWFVHLILAIPRQLSRRENTPLPLKG